MAEGDGHRGRGRLLLLLFLLVAGVAWILWSRRRSAPVALGNIGAVAAPPAATADPEPEPLPGAAAPLPDGSPPSPEYTIKGNTASRLYHLPSSPYYQRTKPGMWFRTPEDAEAAGFTGWRPKRRATG